MQTAIRSILNIGAGGIIVDAECHLSNGLPGIVIVGLGNKAVSEARERVRSAFATSNIRMPRKRITINLAPADVPKESTSLDLCIAMAILQADGQISLPSNLQVAFIGELGLAGEIRGVRGMIGKLLAGKEKDIDTFFIPKANLSQALLVPKTAIYAPQTLRELLDILQTNEQRKAFMGGEDDNIQASRQDSTPLLDEIAGQDRAKRALAIAAAGGHNVLLNGAPGTGKSMLAKALPSLLPPLSREEMLEITHLHSLTGLNYEQLVVTRPFRAPHHSISQVAMIGGGSQLRPGEVTLSHRGVLFLDEIPEFSRQTIESLRQPLEDGLITVTRAKDSVTYPADFMLVATANPCPCGYFGTGEPCICPAHRIAQYRQRLSGPIIDRIDLFVDVEKIRHEQLLVKAPPARSEQLRQNIVAAWAIQMKRYSSSMLNASMDNSTIRTKSHLSSEAHQLLNQAARALHLSARSYMRIIKVARTIADLEPSVVITNNHVSEALQYRPMVVRNPE